MSTLKRQHLKQKTPSPKRQKLHSHKIKDFTSDYYYNALFQVNKKCFLGVKVPNEILTCISDFAQGLVIGCKLGKRCTNGDSILYQMTPKHPHKTLFLYKSIRNNTWHFSFFCNTKISLSISRIF